MSAFYGRDAIHLRMADPAQFKARGQQKQKDLSKKALLLSGPPGIGKTSAATIIARELGFVAVEVNASDTRNKADANAAKGIGGKLANSIKELATNTAIGAGTDGKRKRVCLIMDEVDGMSGGDRGGVSELIQTIKRAKVPIICICNDKYSQKIKSLKNSCLELDFRKPTAQQLAKRLLDVCGAEGLQLNASTLEALYAGADGDIRLIMGQLQMIRLRSRRLSYDEAKGKARVGKDAEMSPFEAARKLLSLEAGRLSLADQIDHVFQDMDLVPLLIQENYVNHRPAIAKDELQQLRVAAKAADAFSAGDVVNRAVRQYGNWGLMPFAAAIGSVYPATYMRGMREPMGLYPTEQNFPRFSAWLGNNSSAGKQRRLLGELHTRMTASGAVAAGRLGLRAHYLPVLRAALQDPLIKQGKEGVPAIVDLLQAYCVNKDALDFILDVTHFKTKAAWGADMLKELPASTKAALTRALNGAGLVPRCALMADNAKKRRSHAAGAAPEPGGDDGDEAEAEGAAAAPEEEEEEEEETDERALERKAKQLARTGIIFQAKENPKAKKGKAAGAKAETGKAAAGQGKRAAKPKK